MPATTSDRGSMIRWFALRHSDAKPPRTFRQVVHCPEGMPFPTISVVHDDVPGGQAIGAP